MIIIQKYSEKDKIAEDQKEEIVKFLFEHLEQYGDPQGEIASAVNYSLGHQNKPGGIIVTATDQKSKTCRGCRREQNRNGRLYS